MPRASGCSICRGTSCARAAAACLDAGTSLKTLDKTEYHARYAPPGTSRHCDEMVEVTFTVSQRVRRIAAHDPSQLSMAEYARQLFWSSGVDIPDNYDQLIQEITLDFVELPPGRRRSCRCSFRRSSSSCSIR